MTKESIILKYVCMHVCIYIYKYIYIYIYIVLKRFDNFIELLNYLQEYSLCVSVKISWLQMI